MTDTLTPPQTFRKTSGIHRIGLSTARPPATGVLPGTIYFSTDTLLLHRSDGVAWDPYSLPPITVPFVFHYRADTSNTAPNDPGAGRIKWNNANQQLATSLYVDVLTSDGFDAVMFYQLVELQDEIIIQDQNVSQNYQLWKLTGSVIQFPDWFEVPVAFVSSGGAGTMQNNQIVSVIIKTGGNSSGGGGTLPTDALGKVLISQGAGVTPVYSAQPLLTDPAPLLRFNHSPGNRTYTVGPHSPDFGTLEFGRTDSAAKLTVFLANAGDGSPVVGIGTDQSSGEILVVRSVGGTIVLTPGDGGGTRTLQIGRRVADNSPGVGAHTEFWPATGQVTSVIATTVPGGASDTFWVMPDGTVHAPAGFATDTPLDASQLTSGTVPDARLSANVQLVSTLGRWTDVPFNAANFTSDTGTFVVNTQHALHYTLTGKTLIYAFFLEATVTGTPTALGIALPSTTVPISAPQAMPFNYSGGVGVALTQNNATLVNLYRDAGFGTPWAAGTYFMAGTITLQVN